MRRAGDGHSADTVDRRLGAGRFRPGAGGTGSGSGGAARLHQVDEGLLGRGCFIPDLDDAAAAWRVARRFLELREDDAVGGFVLRRFERLTSAEVRTWCVAGRCVLVGAHPDSPDDAPAADVDLETVAPLVAGLGLPFVTVDLALHADGVWRVVELGDGQVSDRPTSVDPSVLIAAVR